MKVRLGVVTVLMWATLALATAPGCSSCPICDHRSDLRICWPSLPWFMQQKPQEVNFHLHKCLRDTLSDNVVGQDHLKKRILDVVTFKLTRPNEPLVMHFAGDNGVGKTMLAKEISLATSLRAKRSPSCGPTAECGYGENMLHISCPSFNLLAPDDAVLRIIKLVVDHAKRFPSGIVLLDDAPVLHERVFAGIAPVLGTASSFSQHPDVSLNGLLVILTSDLGKEGRTRGRTPKEIELLIQDQLMTIYNYSNVKFIKTFAFHPFDTAAARQLIRLTVQQTRCRFDGRVTAASVTEGAVDALMHGLNEAGSIVTGNGRAIQLAVLDVVDVKLESYFVQRGIDLKVEVELRESADGGLELKVVPTTPDAATAVAENL